MQNQLKELKTNPVKFLASRKFNIPSNMTQSPQQMIEAITGVQIPQEFSDNPNGYFQYLMTHGQLSKQQQAQYLNAAKFFNF